MLIADSVQLIRDGKHLVTDLMVEGKTMLGRRHVLPHVATSLKEIQVEGTFPDGTYLVTVHYPISSEDGDLEKALYGSFLPTPSQSLFPLVDASEYEREKQPGAVIADGPDIVLNDGRDRRVLWITNKGDRAIQVGSHYHFIEVNPQLEFDRVQAFGYRLDIPSGTAIRFEPAPSRSSSKKVTLVQIGGRKIITGGNNIATGRLGEDRIPKILENLQNGGFLHLPASVTSLEAVKQYSMNRAAYAVMFGPTTGDLVRLGDTELWIKVEKDYTVYGDECKFGGGKSLREGMGQASGRSDAETLDLVITNALVVDYTGIYKADIGVKGGFIAGIGKAGNPDMMDGVHAGMIVGSNTDVIAGEGKIITYGGFDSHASTF